MPTGHHLTDEQRLEIWKAWKAEGLSHVALGHRFKLSQSAIGKALLKERKKPHPKVLTITDAAATTTALAVRATNGSGRRKSFAPKWGHMKEQILALKATGMKPTEIAEKLDMPKKSLAYYLYDHRHKIKLEEKGAFTNGNKSALNINVAVGVAYAETERFISNLAERLGVPTTILRPRLSELLGHSPFR